MTARSAAATSPTSRACCAAVASAASPAVLTIAIRSASSEQNSIRSSASSTAARAPAVSPERAASSVWSAPSTPRYCGSRESTATSAARASCARAAVALVARERQLRPPQRDLQLPVAAGQPPPRDLGERGVGRLPVARVERLLRDQQRQPALPRRERGELRVAGAGDLERLRASGPPGAARRSCSPRSRRCPAGARARAPARARGPARPRPRRARRSPSARRRAR